MGIIKRVKDKIAYERESYRMSGEHLEQVMKDHPFPPFRQRIRMTDAELAEWRRQQRRSGK